MDGERHGARHLLWRTGEVNWLVPLLLSKDERRHTSMLIRIIMYVHINECFIYLVWRVSFAESHVLFYPQLSISFLMCSTFFNLLSLHHHVPSATQ
ncbi:hypothetical protein E2C01_093141 [Portunus trituberculatus]|uniref:Uncharacterized protein n=1 Tax=Portunus trituberculatus TaxID=210409 RepID=A0A5B7JU27_PORTR|nr:hypothetical protein [Portunus trituberculatus]